MTPFSRFKNLISVFRRRRPPAAAKLETTAQRPDATELSAYRQLFGRLEPQPSSVATPPDVKQSPANRHASPRWDQKIKQARKLVAQGSRDEAVPLLDGLDDAVAQLVQADVHHDAVCCLIMTEQCDRATALLNEIHGTRGWFDVRPYAAPQDMAPRFTWTITGQASSILGISERLKGHKSEYFSLDRLMSVLPILVAYRQQPNKTLSSVVLHVGDNAPSAGVGFCSNRDDVFLIPDGVFLRLKAYRATRAAFESNPISWQHRLPVCFWRGGTTGHMEDRAVGWSTLPRVKLCRLAQRNTELLDFGITHIGQVPDTEDVSAIQHSGLMKPFVPSSDFIKYKYQLDIDGNTNSWPGLFQKLLTGSPVLKVQSPRSYRQWFYDRLKPWENYVPVASDLSDLLARLEWLAGHDDEARMIGERGRALAHSLDYPGEIARAGATLAAAFRSCPT